MRIQQYVVKKIHILQAIVQAKVMVAHGHTSWEPLHYLTTYDTLRYSTAEWKKSLSYDLYYFANAHIILATTWVPFVSKQITVLYVWQPEKNYNLFMSKHCHKLYSATF